MITSYLDHIAACNTADLSACAPFSVGAERLGHIRRDLLPALASLQEVFQQQGEGLGLAAPLLSAPPAVRSKALHAALLRLSEAGTLPPPRHEWFAARQCWSAPDHFHIDRGFVEVLGLRAWGVHINGWRPGADGSPALWIGTRALDKKVAPGKLDNLVAGGQPATLSLHENLLKEAEEEASLPPALAAQAVPVGAVTYCMAGEWGIKPDTLFCYDLLVPEDFQPVCNDGEMTGFTLMPAREVLEVIRTSDRVKFNVNLVILDFALRHGLLSPDTDPDYEALAAGLRRL